MASLLVHDFVEGSQSYPVIRRLEMLRVCTDREELTPDSGSSGKQWPQTWSDLPLSESQRLFYNMSLCGRCSELVYAFADLVNGMSGKVSPMYRHRVLAGMFICVGFVTHDYRRLALTKNFGQTYWQHSTQVHNGARNHFWVEFPKPGARPDDQGNRIILDLTAAQYDMRAPRSNVQVVHGQDRRYRKCYELPCTCAPIALLELGE